MQVHSTPDWLLVPAGTAGALGVSVVTVPLAALSVYYGGQVGDEEGTLMMMPVGFAVVAAGAALGAGATVALIEDAPVGKVVKGPSAGRWPVREGPSAA